VKRHILPREHAAAAAPPVVREMPRTKNVPRRCAGGAEQQRNAAALAAAPAPATHQHHDAFQGGGAGASGVTVKEELEEPLQFSVSLSLQNRAFYHFQPVRHTNPKIRPWLQYPCKIHLRARSLQGAAGCDAHRQSVAAGQGPRRYTPVAV